MLRKGHLPSADSVPSRRYPGAKGSGLSRCVDLRLEAGWSPRTIASRRDRLDAFSWWHSQEAIPDRTAPLNARQ